MVAIFLEQITTRALTHTMFVYMLNANNLFKGDRMKNQTSTVNISFNKELLEQIDRVAQRECRSRSELLREAARLYLERKDRWEKIFTYGETRAAEQNLHEDDVPAEVKQNRQEKRDRAEDRS